MTGVFHRAALAALLAQAAPALAGPLVISPTTVEVEPGRRSAAITVTNQSDAPADLQFRAFAWSQDEGGDRLEPTTALIVSPPIATLAPHGRQVFRVLVADPAQAATERTYRLKLNELPRATAAAIAINVEFSLPVFLTPRDAAPVVEWQAARAVTEAIDVGNRGGRRMRIAALALQAADGSRTELAAASSTYILAGASRRFSLPPGRRVTPGMRLVGVTDAGAIDVPLAALAAR